MKYQKILKSNELILSEVKAIAATIEEVDVTGSSFIVVCGTELTQGQIDALLAYNPHTFGAIS